MKKRDNIQIAIDGPAAAGKSTVARLVATELDARYINTGNMYRALTWAALNLGIDPENKPGELIAVLDRLNLHYKLDNNGQPVLMLEQEPVDETAVRDPEVAAKVSFTARIGEVRKWLLKKQRETAEFGRIVIEGRDIGTVVFPQAEYKFFITASPEVRARRRLAQPGEVVDSATVESVATEIARRDEIDQNRPVSPLRPAENAEIIDTDNLTAEEVAERIVTRIRETAEKEDKIDV